MKRILGKSGIEVSPMGMGCWAIGGPWMWAQPGEEPRPAGWGQVDDEVSVRAIHTGIDAGITFFDTAANYGAGHSEMVLGRALQGRRTEVVIATKFGHIVNEEAKTVYGDDAQILKNVRMDVEHSLRRLQTDYIDLYQLHAGDYATEPALELRGLLENLVAEGKIRCYGWSTDLVDHAEVFAGGDNCAAIQFRLNALFDNPEMRQLCAAADLAGINKDPLNKGILTGKFSPASTFPEDDIRSRADFGDAQIVKRLQLVEALRDLLTVGGRSMAQGAIAYIWALDERMIPIPGFKSEAQVRDNAGAMALGPLTEAERAAIDTVVAAHRASADS
jgi:aryl-alcohol dehydrogenase-like predicted oxidoreductase